MPPARARWRLAAAWAFGLGLLGWMVSRVPIEPLVQAVQRPSAWVWGVTLAGLLLSYALRAARLQVVLDLQGRPRASSRWLGLRTDALRVILLHNAAVNLLPMRAGELSFPWLASRELNLPVSRAVVCLLWMRLQDLAVLTALGLALWPGLGVAGRLSGLVGLLLSWHGAWWLLKRWLGSARGSLAQHTGGPGRWRSLAQGLHSALSEPAHHRPAAWGLTWGNWSLKLAAGGSLLSAITQLPWGPGWAGALGGELAAIFPLQGPAGFGTYEAGVWAGIAAWGAPHRPALSDVVGAALALHCCFLVCALLAAAAAALLIRRGAHTDAPPGHPG